ncbi:tetratricopeptide repeat protein [Bernardetia sp.]|uniref:tetratricopeptide repeat protein n=1 Tax=Bernardetia sp. TaxID=1937974 RepID=UPI0025C1AFEC|nr:tetratricopeptide repeat protein [Bernardetia sp.]
MKSYSFVLYFVIALLFSCSQNTEKVNELNEKATKLILENLNSIDEASHQEAIKLLDEALTLDPQNGKAYFSKHYALVRLGKYEEAITTLQNGIKNVKDFQVGDAQRQIGFVYDHMGEDGKAQDHYLSALQAYHLSTNELGNDRSDPKVIRTYTERAFTMMFTEEKNTGLNELISIVEETQDPNASYLLEVAKTDFNKKQYIKDYYGI